MNMESMSIEEKIGQLFIVSFDENEINGDLINLITTYKIGGVLYRSSNFKNPRQVHTLSSKIQRYAQKKLPMFIAVNQFDDNNFMVKKDVTVSPTQQQLGHIHNRLYTKQMSEIIAEELRTMGINLNVAPNLSLANNRHSFGKDIQHTSRHALATVQGAHKFNVISAPQVDDYLEFFQDSFFLSTKLQPYVQKLRAVLETIVISSDTLTDYQAYISAYREANIHEDNITAFDGLIISDCSTSTEPVEAQNLLFSGADLIILNGATENQHKVIDHIIEMAKKDLISEDQLNRSVKRILALKKKMNIGKLEKFHRKNLRSKRSVAFAEKLIRLG